MNIHKLAMYTLYGCASTFSHTEPTDSLIGLDISVYHIHDVQHIIPAQVRAGSDRNEA